MRLELAVGDHAATWEFRGSTALRDWIGGAPWKDEGVVRTIRVRSTALVEPITGALARELPEVEVVSLPCPADGRVDAELARRWRLGELNGLALFDALGDQLRSPTMIVVGPAVSGPGPFESAQVLLERLAKLPTPCAVPILLFDTPDEPLVAEADDFTVGAPVHDVLSLFGDGDARLWAGYLHARVAWECGGDVGRVERWCAAGLPRHAVGDDEAMEAWLCARALEDLGALDSREAAELGRWLDRSAEGRPAAAELERSLRAGTLWRPVGHHRPRPVPWAARALLLRGATTRTQHLLRAALVCVPLARAILTRCFDYEARVRGTTGPLLEADVTDDARRHQQMFDSEEASSASRFYPRTSPARPSSPVSFLSLGEIAHGLRRLRRPFEHLLDLAALRNAVAHGHYVGWRALKTLQQVDRALP